MITEFSELIWVSYSRWDLQLNSSCFQSLQAGQQSPALEETNQQSKTVTWNPCSIIRYTEFRLSAYIFLHSSTIISDKYAIFVPFIFFQSTRLQEAIVISIFLLESYLEKYLYASYGFPVMTTSDHCNYPKTCNPLCIFRSTNFTNPQTMYTELLL